MKYYGLGRRKSSVAQVYITSFEKISTKPPTAGLFSTPAALSAQPPVTPMSTRRPSSGQKIPLENIIINQRNLLDYFQNDPHFIQSIQQILKIFDQPLHIRVIVFGGGSSGQKDAIRLALARALSQLGSRTLDQQYHSVLKKKNLLTQDARRKERKKYGLKKARKAPQYSKR